VKGANVVAFEQVVASAPGMSLAEIKSAVNELSEAELTELASFIHQREDLAWDRQIDADFAENGRLRGVLEEVRAEHSGAAPCH
jgi:hypothetical protein